MSKLLRLKEWLTVPDAARYLSLRLEEAVSEADVLRLALDGRLKLSLNHEWVSDMGTLIIDRRGKQVLEIESHPEIEGLLDLTMRGGERYYVKHMHRTLIIGPGVDPNYLGCVPAVTAEADA